MFPPFSSPLVYNISDRKKFAKLSKKTIKNRIKNEIANSPNFEKPHSKDFSAKYPQFEGKHHYRQEQLFHGILQNPTPEFGRAACNRDSLSICTTPILMNISIGKSPRFSNTSYNKSGKITFSKSRINIFSES